HGRNLVGRQNGQLPPHHDSYVWIETISGMIRIATMFVILLIGLIAGPAVSLYGSPTVSPVTAAACASEPLPPNAPSSISFFALSHAPPPEGIALARDRHITL